MILQIQILKIKLEDYKLEHSKTESVIENEIEIITEKKNQVQTSLDQKLKSFDISLGFPK